MANRERGPIRNKHLFVTSNAFSLYTYSMLRHSFMFYLMTLFELQREVLNVYIKCKVSSLLNKIINLHTG